MKQGIKIHLVTKLIVSYFLLILLPFALSSYIMSRMSTENIKENTLTYINLFVKQISSNIDSYISELDRMTKIAVLDDRLCGYLTSDDRSAVFSYEADQYFSGYMLQLMTQQPNIQTVTFLGRNARVFTGASNSVHDMDAFRQTAGLDELDASQHKLLFSNAHIPEYLLINPGEPVFCVVRNLYALDSSYIGSIVLNVVSENLIDIININPSLLESGARITITNKDGEILADTSSDFNAENLADKGRMLFSPEGADDRELFFSDLSAESGLTTTVRISKSQLFHSTETFNIYSGALIAVLAAVILTLSVYFSFRLVKPIKELKAATEECADGNYDVRIPVQTGDEIGMLCSSFNTMAIKLKNLLESVYLYQLQTKQAQLEALQNQINPHFLHNTLETIRMKALLNQDREVAGMIKLLARLFRITLDRTHNVVTLKDELEHVDTYVKVQNMRFNGRFQLSLNVREELKSCCIIKLTLQPIVENCIVHGFADTFEEEIIRIDITADDRTVFISICDNGKGIEPDNLERLKARIRHAGSAAPESGERSSIGIVNISERIRLEYGPDYGLDIGPGGEGGTVVRLWIPRNESLPGSFA
jgi:two-component system sensor histidine kinase YesM